MAGSLTLSPAAAPFPWAAAAIATYTGKASLNFDTAATGLSLDLDGSQLTAEDDIVQALAKAGGLSDDSAKVLDAYVSHMSRAHGGADVLVFRARQNTAYSHRLPRDYSRARLA